MRPTTKRSGSSGAARKPAGTRIQAACSDEEAALLRQLAEGWGVTPAAAVRRLIRDEAARQRRGNGQTGLSSAPIAAAAPVRRGQGWVATLAYEAPPIWDAMQSHLAVLNERLREQWPGFSEGVTHPATDRTHVYVEFTMPDGAGAAELRDWLADEWTQIARDAGPVEIEDAAVWSARHGDRAA